MFRALLHGGGEGGARERVPGSLLLDFDIIGGVISSAPPPPLVFTLMCPLFLPANKFILLRRRFNSSPRVRTRGLITRRAVGVPVSPGAPFSKYCMCDAANHTNFICEATPFAVANSLHRMLG